MVRLEDQMNNENLETLQKIFEVRNEAILTSYMAIIYYVYL